MKEEYKYAAFISYRQLRPDSQIAKHLHRTLETYRVPRALIKQGVPRRLGRVFRDKEELAASTNLGRTIHEAIENSRFLIVVCSRKTQESKWIRKEVLDFIELGREDRILTLLIDGEPEESFPSPLLESQSATGFLVEGSEPLAADIRTSSLRKSISKLKTEKLRLIAPMIGRSYDELKQRQRERTINRLITISAMSVFGAIFFAILAGYAFYQKSEADRRRMISLEQSLSVIALREKQSLKFDERAALIARQAHLFSKRHTGSRLDQIDLALRRVLESPRFCISLKASTNGNSAVVFSKTDNQLAVAGSDRIIRIWNLSRSEEQPVIIESCPGIVRALSFNLKNNRLIAITKDDELVSWTLNPSHSASTLLFVRKVSDSRVTAASFSSDGNRLVTSHEKGFFLVWNLLEPNVAPQKYPFPKGKFEISAITFHPNKNDMLITGDDFGVVKLWYLNQLTSQPRELGRHNSPVSSVAVSPDGFLIASGSELTVKAQSLKSWVFETEGNEDFVLTKGDVRIWKDDKIDSEPIILDEITGTVSSLTFSPSGDSLAFGDVGSGNVSLYSLSGTKIQSMVLPSLEAGVFALCFNKNDKMLAAVSNNDPNVRIWNLSRPRGLPIELIGHSEAVVSLAFSPSGNQLLSAGDGDGTIRLWQFGGTFRELTRVTKLGPFRGSIFDVTFGQDDWRFASGSGNQPGEPDPDNTVRIWNYNISEKAVKLSGNESPITSVVFNSGGNLIACSGEDYKEIMVWDIANLTSPKEVISTGQSSVTSLAFRPNSDAIAWGSSDGSLRLLELNTHKTINFLHKQKAITTIAFDPKGVFIAAGIDDSSIVVWRVDSPKNVISILRGHDGMINDIDINVDLILASASTDGTVRLWDLKEVKNYPRVLKGPWSAVFSISFSHDGYWLAVGSSNPVILLYPLTDELSKIVCQNVWRNLTNKEWQDVMGDGIEYECTCQNFNPGYDTKLDACPYVK